MLTLFNASIPTLGEKKDSPSLLFGSIVDTLLTGSQQEFNERFFVADIEMPEPSNVAITKALFDIFKDSAPRITDINDAYIIAKTEELSYHLNWKPETRAKVIKEKCAEYYNMLLIAETKTIVDNETYNQALAAVEALRTSPATKWYFAPDDPFDDSIERLYQGKFRATFDGLEYSCMADLIICDHKNKIIYPCDLKTSSHMEYEFYKSFLDWSYSIQAGEYAAILKANLEKDEYFKDFKIMPYRFIVVNKNSLNPLVWEWPYTFCDTEVIVKTSKGYPIKLRNFRTIGKELSHYLKTQQKVPEGITTEPNNIQEWIERM